MIVVPALLTKATLVINPLASSLTLILIMVESMILIYMRGDRSFGRGRG